MKLRPHSISTKTLSTLHNASFETLKPSQNHQIRLYVDTLLQWNHKMNLVAVTEVNEVMERHVQDWLAIIPPIRDSYVSHCTASCHDISLVNVRTGADLPKLIFAIACPGWKVTLLESMNKRCSFLKNVVSHIGLSNMQVVRGRAEELGTYTSFREMYDVDVVRAVAEMRIMAESFLPLVRLGDLFMAAKGHDPQEEIKKMQKGQLACWGLPYCNSAQLNHTVLVGNVVVDVGVDGVRVCVRAMFGFLGFGYVVLATVKCYVSCVCLWLDWECNELIC